MIPQARAYLHAGDFSRLGQFTTAERINRTYRHITPQQINTASLSIAARDPLLPTAEEQRDRGLILVIESEAYPVPWVGVITDLDYDHEGGRVNIRALGWGVVLQQRYFDSVASFAGTPGSVFAAMADALNALNSTGLALGTVSDPGTPYELDVADGQGFRALNQLAQETGQEWWIEVERADESGIRLTLNFGPDRGEDQRAAGPPLVDPGNCTVTQSGIDTQSSLIAATITGGQTSVTQAYAGRTRATALSPSAESGLLGLTHTTSTVNEIGLRERHGVVFFPQGSSVSPVTRRQALQVSESLRGSGAVSTAATAVLERRPFAARRMRITVDTWTDAASWDHLRVGNLVHMRSADAFGVGFEGPLSIVGVQPFEEGGFCDLVVWVGEDD